MGKANTHLRTLLCYQCTRGLRNKNVNANARVQDQVDGGVTKKSSCFQRLHERHCCWRDQPHTKRAADTLEPKPLSTERDH